MSGGNLVFNMTLFNTLPGLEMPIVEVTETLSKMWQNQRYESSKNPPLLHSCQLNLIIHNGLDASKEAALECFECAIQFSKKYPCRIVVLCPEKASGNITPLKGKLFSECLIGNDMRQEYYCEALILSYTTDDTIFLTNQVSLWLENDLPTYYWIHQIPVTAIKMYYLTLTSLCSKVIYDSSVEPEEFQTIQWPNSQPTADLALMRLLPIRQSLGQFFSNYSPASLVDTLKKVTVHYHSNFFAEGRQLIDWFKKSLMECAQLADLNFDVEFTLQESTNDLFSLKSQWRYANDNAFDWTYDSQSGISELKALFNNQTISYPLQLRKIHRDEALAAALFY